jgi:haloacetate dehalogenase
VSPTALFPTCRAFDVPVGDVTLHGITGGHGAPVVLLHGYPQTHAIWHRVVPALLPHHTVVAVDLRGYGDSTAPVHSADHAPMSKRAMAADITALMRALGHDRFAVVGHDRGGRVAHRLAVDHVDRITRVAVLDIAPTRHMYANTTRAFAQAYWHWFFLIQPAPLPETLIGADPAGFLRLAGRANDTVHDPRAVAEYVRCFDHQTIAASCEDYRAAATIDLGHDDADVTAGIRVRAPLLALWGARGVVGRLFDVLAAWREVADDVRGHAVDGGHYLAEERPDDVIAALTPFLAGR